MIVMNYDYKYRLYPSLEQETALEHTLDTCRSLYNHFLEEVKSQDKIPNKYELQREIPELKTEWSDLKNIHSRVLLMVLRRLYNNIDAITPNYSQNKVDHVNRLRYKGEGWYKTFTYHQSGFDLQIEDNWLDTIYLSKIGNVPIRYHRDLPENAEIKQVKIKKEDNGEWYAIIGIEVDENTEPIEEPESVVTLGAGMDAFSVDSEGLAVPEPDYDELERQRKRIKQNLDRKDSASKSFKSEKNKLGSIDTKIERKQDDFLHKLSRYYVDTYDVIIIEGRYIGRRNSSWWRFVRMIEYKAESAGTHIIQTDPDLSATYICSDCGVEASEQYWLREYGCPSCGFGQTRDNEDLQYIQRIGSNEVGLEQAEVKSVDIIATVEELLSSASGMVEAESSSKENCSLPYSC